MDPTIPQPQRPALRTAGLGLGLPSGGFVLGMIVDQLLSTGFDDWKTLLAKLVAFGGLAGWAWLTAKHPEVATGFDRFDAPKGEG